MTAPLPFEQFSLRRVSIACAFAAFILYCFTLAPTFGWGDSADLALRMVVDSDTSFTASHRNYSFYRAVGSVFQRIPIGDAGTRANLMSAFFGALTVGLIAAFCGIILRSITAAIAAAISLTVSHTFWLMSVLAEVYTFNAAFIFAAYLCIAMWWQSGRHHYLLAAACCTGLALTHHATGLVLAATAAPLVLMRIRTLPAKIIAASLLTFFATSFPYWQLSLTHLQAGKPILYALNLDTPTNAFHQPAPLRELAKFIAYASYNFLSPAILLAAIGFIAAYKQRRFEMLPPTLWMLALILAGITSTIPDTFNIYVLVYPVLAIAVGIGVNTLRTKYFATKQRTLALLIALALMPPVGYLAAIHTSKALGRDLVGARSIPYRDNAWYFMWPAKNGDTGPRHYAEQALRDLEPNAILIADYSLWRPLLLLQTLEQQRPDVTLAWAEPLTWYGGIASYIAKQPCSKPIYLATDSPPEYYQLAELKKHYILTATGVIFRVNRRCHP